MIHKIAEFTGLPLLAVEAGFLLLLTIIFVTTNYITRLLERGYKDRKLYKVNYDLKTEQSVLDMLQAGKSCQEIIKNIYVSEEYVQMIEGLAEEEGLLAKKPE